MSQNAPSPSSAASPTKLALSGAWRFAAVSVGAFGVWAFGGRWFYQGPGEGALFAATAVAMVALAGLFLPPLLTPPRRARTLYRVFVPAFLAYALLWSLCWFLLGGRLGEWLGSLLGVIAFVGLTAWLLGNLRPFLKATVVFFVTHAAGYFSGGALMAGIFESAQGGVLSGVSSTVVAIFGKLAWGLLYGLGFGAGLGYTFGACRPPTPSGGRT